MTSFQSAVVLTDTVQLDTGAGAGSIAFNNTLNGTGINLTLIADEGDIDFDGIVGGAGRVGVISISSAADVTADLAVTAERLFQTTGTGTTH